MQNLNIMLEQLVSYIPKLLKSQIKRLKVDQFTRLIEKLIKDPALFEQISENDQETLKLIEKTYNLLSTAVSQEMVNNLVIREYVLTYREVNKRLKKNYDLVPKGTYIAIFMGSGIAIGTGVGVAFMSSYPSMYSVGIALGLVFGVSIGNMKENEAIKAGKIY